VSRRLPPSPLGVTFVLLLAATALVPFLGPPAAAFGERPFDSNTVISGTNNLLVYSSQSVAQSFLASASYRLTEVTLRLRNTGDTTRGITISIRTDAGGNPASSSLTSRSFILGNNDLTNAQVSFSTQPQLTAGVEYWIVAASSSSVINAYEWHHSNADTYANGQAKTGVSSSWFPASTDMYFVTTGREMAANLTTTLLAINPSPSPGRSATFRLYLNNTGDTTATTAWVNDTQAPGLPYISDSGASAGSTSPWPSFTFPNIGNGARWFDVIAKVPIGTEPGTVLTKALTLAYVDGTGSVVTRSPAQASILVGVQAKQLYLDPASVGPSRRLDPARPTGGSGSMFSETLPKDGSGHDYDLDPVLARSFHALDSRATLFLDSATHDVRTLRFNLTVSDWNGVTLTPIASVEQAVTTNAFNDYQPFAFPFPSFNHTFPVSGRIRLTVRNLASSPTDALLAMNASFAASVLELDTTTYVRIDQIDMRDAIGSATVWSPKDTLVVQANVSDPFGSSEISGAWINLTSPSGSLIVNYTAMALFATDPASPSAWKVFRFTLPPSLQQGTYHATVTAVESNGVLDVAESSALVRAPAFSIAKTATRSNVRGGDSFSYDLWFNNTGSGSAGRLWINDSLPSELTFLSSSDPGAMTGSYNWTWTLLGYGNYRLTLDVQVKTAVPPVPYFRNFAFLNYTDEKGFSWPMRTAFADVALSGPVISLTKSSVKTQLHSRESIVYQITMQNTGDTAQTLWVNDTLPAGLSYVADTASSLGGARLLCSALCFRFTTMQGSQTWSFTITAVAAPDLVRGTILTNTVSLNYTNANGFLLPPKITTWPVLVSAPDIRSAAIAVARTRVTPADILAATVTFANIGTEAAADAWVNLTLSSNLIFVNASLVAYYDGDEVHFTLAGVPLGSTTIFLNASVDSAVGDHALMRINGTLGYTDAYRNEMPRILIASGLVEASVPKITLRVSPPTLLVEADAVVFYNIYLVNTGSGVAGDVNLSLPLPASFLYVMDTAGISGGTRNLLGSIYTWNWTDVGPGSRSFTLEMKAKSTVLNGTRAILKFHADYRDLNGNFRSNETSAVANFGASQIVLTLPSPTADAHAGDTRTYVLTIRNVGGFVAHNLWLVFTNDSHFDIVSSNSSVRAFPQGDQQLNWSFTDVQPGESLAVRIDLRVRDGTPIGIVLPIVFEAEYTNSVDTVIGYARVDATVRVLTDPVAYVWIGLAVAGLGSLIFFVVYRRWGTLIEEVFLVYRDGVLLYHLSRSLSQDKDEDVLSGMLTAVTEFVRDAFVYGEHRELHQLDFGDYRIMIERGRNLYLAVVYAGKGASVIRKKVRWVLDHIEAAYGSVLEKWDGDMDKVAGARDLIREYLLKTSRKSFRGLPGLP